MNNFQPLNKTGIKSSVFLSLSIILPLILAIFAIGVYDSGESRFATLILTQGISKEKVALLQKDIESKTSVSNAEFFSSQDAALFLEKKSKINVADLGILSTDLPPRIRIEAQVGYTFEGVAGDLQEILLSPVIETFVVPEKHDFFLAPASFALFLSIFLFALLTPLGWHFLVTDLRLHSEESFRRIELLGVFGRQQKEMRNIELGRGIKDGIQVAIISLVLLLFAAMGGHFLFPAIGIQFEGSMIIWGLIMSPLLPIPLISTSARRHVLAEFL